MEQSIREFRKKGVGTGNHMLALLLLDEPCGLKSLANAVGISTAAMTQCADKFVASGLAKVTHDFKDRRAKWISRTPSGTALVNKARKLASK